MFEFWSFDYELHSNKNSVVIHPGTTLTIGKNTECSIKLGKRAMKTSKQIITVQLSKCLTKLIISLLQGATIKVFVTGAKVTPKKQQLMDSSDELIVENEDFKAEFVFRENLEFKCAIGAEIDSRVFPRCWRVTEVEDMDDDKVLIYESGKLVYETDIDAIISLIDSIKNGASMNQTVIKMPEVPKKTARKTSKTKNSMEMFGDTNDTNATIGLSVTGREDFDKVMEHLKQQRSSSNKYVTKAQKVLQSVQLEEYSENMMTQKTLNFTVVSQKPSEKMNTARKQLIKRKIFKQKNVNIMRGDFLYE